MARKTQQSRGRAQRRAFFKKDWRRWECGCALCRRNPFEGLPRKEITIEDEFTATLGRPEDNLDFQMGFEVKSEPSLDETTIAQLRWYKQGDHHSEFIVEYGFGGVVHAGLYV